MDLVLVLGVVVGRLVPLGGRVGVKERLPLRNAICPKM